MGKKNWESPIVIGGKLWYPKKAIFWDSGGKKKEKTTSIQQAVDHFANAA